MDKWEMVQAESHSVIVVLSFLTKFIEGTKKVDEP